MYCEKCGKEIVEGASFCINCGMAVNEKNTEQIDESIKNQAKEDTKQNTMDKKEKGIWIAVIAVIFLIVVPTSIYFAHKNSPSVNMITSLSEGNIDDAVIYYGEIDTTEKKLKAKEDIKKYADNLVESYINEQDSAEYVTVISTLNKLSNGVLDESEVQTKIELVECINESRTQYAIAVKHQEEGNWAGAIGAYNKVIGEDTQYYSKAQEELPKLMEKLRIECMAEVENYINNENYEDAKASLETALLAMPTDSQLVSELEIVKSKIREKDINDVIVSVETCIAEDNYIQGFEEIENALAKYPEEILLQSKLDSLEACYKEYQISKLEEYYNKEEFSAAIIMLKEMQNYLPDDSEIQELIVKYESYLPIPLVDLEIYEKRSVEKINTTLGDNFGNEYTKSMCLHASEALFSGLDNIEGTLEYLINGKYNCVSGTLAYWTGVSSSLRRGKSHLEIYSDDVLVYSSPQISEDSTPVSFEIQLGNDCHKLTIKLIPEDTYDSYVVLGNVQVYNR